MTKRTVSTKLTSMVVIGAMLFTAACGSDDAGTSDTGATETGGADGDTGGDTTVGSATTDADEPAVETSAAPISTSPGDDGGHGATIEEWVEGARAEAGTLTINWGHDGIAQSIGAWEAGFNDYFDLDVSVVFNPSPNMPGNLATLVDEFNSDRAATVDASLLSQELFYGGNANGADVFEIIDWAEAAPHWPDGVALSDDSGVLLLHQLRGFAYNTNEIAPEDLPQTPDDIATLAAERPIATTPYAGGFKELAAPDLLGEEALIAHIEAFGAEQTGLIGCSDIDRIATGEFVGFWVNCGKNLIDLARIERGAPVDTHFVDGTANATPWVMGVPKNSPNPNTARLWLYYLNTPEAQEILFENSYADNIYVDGSRTAQDIAEIEAQGIEMVVIDYEYMLAHPIIADDGLAGRLIGALSGR